MFSKTAFALAAASLALAATAVTPAMANYAPCYENPAASGCPGDINPKATANSHRAEHPTPHTTRHHG